MPTGRLSRRHPPHLAVKTHLIHHSPQSHAIASLSQSVADLAHAVTFINNFSFFLACVNVNTSKMEHCDLVKHCQSIRSELFAAVEAGLKNTHHTNSHPVTAFLCPHPSEACSTVLHTAHVSDNGKQWICSVNCNIYDTLTQQQTLWLCTPGEQAYFNLTLCIHKLCLLYCSVLRDFF